MALKIPEVERQRRQGSRNSCPTNAKTYDCKCLKRLLGTVVDYVVARVVAATQSPSQPIIILTRKLECGNECEI